MDINIQKFRISLIWTRLLRDPINGLPLAAIPCLTDKQQYTKKFAGLVRNTGENQELALPWNQTSISKHNFWSYYLGAVVPFPNASVTAADQDNFWNGGVPFRRRIALAPRIKEEGGDIKLAGYFNRFSVTLLATIEWEGEFSMADCWNLAYDTKENQLFSIGNDTRSYSIHEIAALAFEELLAFASGQPGYNNATEIPRDPFLITSILKGANIDKLKTKDVLLLKDFNDLSYTLHDLTCWKNDLFPNRAGHPVLPSPDDVRIKNKLQPEQGDIFYRQRRGRMIWIPRYFENTVTTPDAAPGATSSQKRMQKTAFIIQKRNQKKIACFHNNTLFLTIQLESLCLFIKELDLAFQDPAKTAALSKDIDDWARRAIQYLSNLYLGRDENITGDLAAEKTYRSLSSRLYITDNNTLASLNRLRNKYNMKSLPAAT